MPLRLCIGITAICLVLLIPSVTKADCTRKFHNLNRYAHKRWAKVFRDREVSPALKALLKKITVS
jgi:hypothetical protein